MKQPKKCGLLNFTQKYKGKFEFLTEADSKLIQREWGAQFECRHNYLKGFG